MGTNWAQLPSGLNPAARRLVGELRGLKDAHELSLAQLSAATHYSRASWERWLNGKRLITREALRAAAVRFGADPGTLLELLQRAEIGDGSLDAAPGTNAEVSAGAEAEPSTVQPIAQLPASTADFTGRHTQIEDLCAALLPEAGQPGQTSIAAVTGGGGLGKTTLAVHVAHRIAERFPDGQLYVDLLGADERALEPGTVLGQWLRALGDAPADLPEELEERAARYRSLLSERRLLVVLDNARDAEQIRLLLPASNGCAALITSRNRLVELPGAFRFDLGSLPDEEATTLLAQLAGAPRLAAEPAAAAELLRACGGIPLALRIVGARLAARAGWPASALADRLADERRRLDELSVGDLAARASFQVSYDALGTASGFDDEDGAVLRRTFRLLGLASGPDIGLPAAAALLGVGEDRAELWLERLVDAYLVESPAPERYRMHDLVRLYAAERAQIEEDAAERANAVERLVGWYAASAADAHRLLSPQSRAVPVDEISPSVPAKRFAERGEALDWCEAERANLVAAVLQSAEAEYGCGALSWKLAAGMLGFFEARRYLADWTSTHLAALAAAQRAQDLAGEAWMYNNLGFAYFYWGETERKALDCFERSGEIRVRLGDRMGEAFALNNAGVAAHKLGESDKAIGLIEQGARIREELGDGAGAVLANLNLSAIVLTKAENEQAERYLMRGLQLAQELGLDEMVCKTLNSLGSLYINTGRAEEAKPHLFRVLRMSHEARFVSTEALALENLGSAFHGSGETQIAVGYWLQAIEIYERIGDPGIEFVRAEMAAALGE
jgi:tetratricopeptide (TPR) repeat protein/transcriptional regulator with XRE-family HTH domain